MSDNVYSVTEIYGSSKHSIADAVTNAVETAAQTIRHTEWFEVFEIRGHIDNDKVAHYQVGVKIGFRYERAK